MADLDSSSDMFEDSPRSERDWRGTPLELLTPKNICTYPAVRSTPNHTVLFKSELKSRWEIIRNSLSRPIKTSEDLERAILSYNTQSSASCRLTFDALHEFFGETLKEEEAAYYFHSLMPGIINLALEIEDKFRGALPILKRGANRSISMSQTQAGVLLANAFLCTFPRRNSNSHQSILPSINFNKLFQCGSLSSVQQKLKCFTNYFRRILRQRPTGVVTFTRRHLRQSELPKWFSCEAKFSAVHIASTGTIEDKGGGMMEIDFANKLVGGGVLGRGAVQEEIRFLICPELVVARLFCESLDDTEALIVTGCERFNSYEGYGQTFSWSENYDDSQRPRDSYRRLNTIVVAIDALYNIRQADQFRPEMITREINKAYSGFSFGSEGAIATGNWGCGAFKGDPLLKFLIQLMAASACRKPLAFFTFGDSQLRDTLYEMHCFLTRKNITVATLWKVVRAYATSESQEKSGQGLYNYVYCTLDADADSFFDAMECSEESPNSGRNKRKYENRDSDSCKSPQETKKPNDLELKPEGLHNKQKSVEEVNDNLGGEYPGKLDTTPEKPGKNVSEDSGKYNFKMENLPEDKFYSGTNNSCKFVPKRPLRGNEGQFLRNKTSPPGVENLTIAPKDVVIKNGLVNGVVKKKLSLKPEAPSFSMDDSTDDIFSKDVGHRLSGKAEPVDAETCSLTTEEGRRKCLATDQQRWIAYQTAMSKFGSETKIDDTSPNASQSSMRTPKGPAKRKISDYFPKATPSPR